MPLPDADLVLRLLREIASLPTAPYQEDAPRAAVRAELARLGLETRSDRYGNLRADARRGAPRQSVALVAHLDHPALEVVESRGRTGRARIRGGILTRDFRAPVPLLVQRAEGAVRARATDLVREVEEPDWSPGHVRIEAEADLMVGDWAVLDLPAFGHEGDEVRLRAADDLAGCALILATLHLLRNEPRAHHVLGVFTRAEEPGLFGARLAIEEELVPRDAIVVSLEASRALPGAEPGKGPVIRVGDAYHTFDDGAESYLRVARERLAAIGVRVQRQLMYGGTCEGSAFSDAGYRTTALAFPIVNYHNDGPDGPAPEIVRVSDFRGAAFLLAEAAVAAAEEATESYRVVTGRVPDEIRRRLG